MVRYRFVFLGLWLLVSVGAFAETADDLRRRLVGGTHKSLSGEFVIHDPPVADNYPLRISANSTNVVQLDPALLAVSCDRIKKALLICLGLPDRWQGKIYIMLHHAHSLDEEVAVTPALMSGTWVYYLDLPDLIERPRLVAGLAEVTLLEIANREADHSTEMPVWLVQGLSREIQSFSPADLVLTPPGKFENGVNLSRTSRLTEPNEDLEKLRARLRATLPLTLEQLSFPGPGQFSGTAVEAYRDSAQLFVHQLLALKDGHAAMQAFIVELPGHLNWQLAFLHAFQADFSSQREFEKWWDLSLSEFCGRTIAQAWSSDETWDRLNEAIHQDVEIRTGGRDLPLHSQMSLQKIITEWETPDRDAVLHDKIHELFLLQLHSSPDLAGMVANYRQALETFEHRKPTPINYFPGKNPNYERPEDPVGDLLKQLDELDARRLQVRPEKESGAPGPLQVGSNH